MRRPLQSALGKRYAHSKTPEIRLIGMIQRPVLPAASDRPLPIRTALLAKSLVDKVYIFTNDNKFDSSIRSKIEPLRLETVIRCIKLAAEPLPKVHATAELVFVYPTKGRF